MRRTIIIYLATVAAFALCVSLYAGMANFKTGGAGLALIFQIVIAAFFLAPALLTGAHMGISSPRISSPIRYLAESGIVGALTTLIWAGLAMPVLGYAILALVQGLNYPGLLRSDDLMTGAAFGGFGLAMGLLGGLFSVRGRPRADHLERATERRVKIFRVLMIVSVLMMIPTAWLSYYIAAAFHPDSQTRVRFAPQAPPATETPDMTPHDSYTP